VLTRQHRQEALSRAYIQAVAALAGMSVTWKATDYGVDLSLNQIKQRGRRFVEAGVQLDVQLKSTTVASVVETHVRHDLEVKSYEDLRDVAVRVPRILVLVVLPEEEMDWLSVTEAKLIVRHAGYWISLTGYPPSIGTKTIRVALPRSNLFSVEALQNLVARTSKGERL
jgi:hypothetical protein